MADQDGAARGSSGKLVVADLAQQPGRLGADDQVGLGTQADLAGLVQGGLVVLGQPRQTGDREVVVALLDGEGNGPLDQPCDPQGDGRLLRDSTGHSETLAHPDGPDPIAQSAYGADRYQEVPSMSSRRTAGPIGAVKAVHICGTDRDVALGYNAQRLLAAPRSETREQVARQIRRHAKDRAREILRWDRMI